MQIINNVNELREFIKVWRVSGETIAFVPTMGNLHAGHLQLVTQAKAVADRVVVSIFVNPTQFGVGEDFESYPRTEKEDQEKLVSADVDVLFLPSVDDIYTSDARTTVTVTDVSDWYCGAYRPGHFAGVATVVCKLFNIVQPNIALFGLKDFQQLTIIRIMVRDLNIPVEIMGVDTVREANGLAMSSRNTYLTESEKQVASELYRVLCVIRDAILSGVSSYAELEEQALLSLQQVGFKPDYLSVCRSSDLKKAALEDKDLVLLVAVRLGKTRLIDNIYFSK
ncbi:MAG: pantoate--beta-alanine ligase [Methylococcales bacterium]|nr:MAG: pantoate--beta-alanine ligase [Methylococcales bacterium]